jgi:hypothetical protein
MTGPANTTLLLLHAQVLIDLKPVENGSLYEDFDMLPPKKIKASVGCARNAAARMHSTITSCYLCSSLVC